MWCQWKRIDNQGRLWKHNQREEKQDDPGSTTREKNRKKIMEAQPERWRTGRRSWKHNQIEEEPGEDSDKDQEKHMESIEEIARKYGMGVTELRKIVGYRRDWMSWIKAVPMLWHIRDGRRRRIGLIYCLCIYSVTCYLIFSQLQKVG